MSSRLRAIAAAAAVIASLAPAASAQAQATVMRFSSTETLSDTATDDCRGALPGTVTGTSTTSGMFVDTYPPTQGFHFHGTETGTYRIAFVDGSYAIGSFSSHFDGGGPITPQQEAFFTSTSTVLDTATIYAASGELLGSEIIHEVSHITAQDLPPFGPSDTDTIRVSFDNPRLTCSL